MAPKPIKADPPHLPHGIFRENKASEPLRHEDVVERNEHAADLGERLRVKAESPGFQDFIADTFQVRDEKKIGELQDDILNQADWTPIIKTGTATNFDAAFTPGSEQAGPSILLGDHLEHRSMAEAYWEEVGHAIDHRLRDGQGDAMGDEGEIFVDRLMGRPSSPQAFSDDHLSIDMGDGVVVEAERNEALRKTVQTEGQAIINSLGIQDPPPTELLAPSNVNLLGAAPDINFTSEPELKAYISNVASSFGYKFNADTNVLTAGGVDVPVVFDPLGNQNAWGVFNHNVGKMGINTNYFPKLQNMQKDFEAGLRSQGLNDQQIKEGLNAFNEYARGHFGSVLSHELAHATQYDSLGKDYLTWSGQMEAAAHY
ncbi:MAG: hypothetical protein AAF449_06150, partial [Myxococcota bacterium]